MKKNDGEFQSPRSMAVLTWTVFSSIFCAMVFYYYPQMTSKPCTTTFEKLEYDFIIIGAGSAGSVMAGRLSEVDHWNVVVLEAGDDETVFSKTPIFHLDLIGSQMDWKYKTVKQKHACLEVDGFCDYPRGKALGGSSSINGMLYMRGIAKDYDTWEKLGAEGWGYKDVREFFLKSENMKDDALAMSPHHKRGGPLTVQRAKYTFPLVDDLIKAGEELGLKNQDYNGEHPSTITRPQLTLNEVERWSTSAAFLRPASNRRNLDIVKNAFVTKILIDPNTKRAIGVEYTINGSTHTVRAKKEVILSAGTINSPKILMLSGIGVKSQLEQKGITSVADLPVGRNYQDQTKVQMSYKFKGRVGLPPSSYLTAEALGNLFVNKTGPLSTNGLDVIILFSTGSDISSDFPDSMCHVLFVTQEEPPENSTIISFYTTKIHVKSVGEIKLNSKNPEDPPLIDPRYFSNGEDLTKTVEAMKIIDKLVKTKSAEKYEPEWYLPNSKLCVPLFSNFDEFLKCLAKTYSSTMFHPVGSVKMGKENDPTTVLTPDLKVKGFPNLRVIDASVMPSLPTADPNAVVIMIAEKGADIIKKEYKVKSFQ